MSSLKFIRQEIFRKAMSLLVMGIFVLQTSLPCFAQSVMDLPVPGAMVAPSAGYVPALIRGITLDPDNPLKFDFIIDTGNSALADNALADESTKLIKYFLASLTVPENELWVNLSPYEKNRIATESFGATEMGRDLLAQDYILKQLSATLTQPETDLGKRYWEKVGTVPALKGTVPTFSLSKVWIVPDEAVVQEYKNSAFVVKSHLKVMMEEDYEKGTVPALKGTVPFSGASENQGQSPRERGQSLIFRQLILPRIEKEVNEGKNFANLRQIYNSMILAAWFKNNLRQSLLGQVYVDKNKILGVDADDPQIKEKIYGQYLAAFKKGVYNAIREEEDPVTGETIPRKYFSGGFMGSHMVEMVAGSTVHNGSAPDIKPKGRMFRVAASLIENLQKKIAVLGRKTLPAILSGTLLATGGLENVVAQQLTPTTMVNGIYGKLFEESQSPNHAKDLKVRIQAGDTLETLIQQVAIRKRVYIDNIRSNINKADVMKWLEFDNPDIARTDFFKPGNVLIVNNMGYYLEIQRDLSRMTIIDQSADEPPVYFIEPDDSNFNHAGVAYGKVGVIVNVSVFERQTSPLPQFEKWIKPNALSDFVEKNRGNRTSLDVNRLRIASVVDHEKAHTETIFGILKVWADPELDGLDPGMLNAFRIELPAYLRGAANSSWIEKSLAEIISEANGTINQYSTIERKVSNKVYRVILRKVLRDLGYMDYLIDVKNIPEVEVRKMFESEKLFSEAQFQNIVDFLGIVDPPRIVNTLKANYAFVTGHTMPDSVGARYVTAKVLQASDLLAAQRVEWMTSRERMINAGVVDSSRKFSLSPPYFVDNHERIPVYKVGVHGSSLETLIDRIIYLQAYKVPKSYRVFRQTIDSHEAARLMALDNPGMNPADMFAPGHTLNIRNLEDYIFWRRDLIDLHPISQMTVKGVPVYFVYLPGYDKHGSSYGLSGVIVNINDYSYGQSPDLDPGTVQKNIDNIISNMVRSVNSQVSRIASSYKLSPGDFIAEPVTADNIPAKVREQIKLLFSPNVKTDKDSPSATPAATATNNLSSLAPADDSNVGGINFDPALLNLQIKRDPSGRPLPVVQQPIGSMDIQGFYPLIIEIKPVNNLPLLLSSKK